MAKYRPTDSLTGPRATGEAASYLVMSVCAVLAITLASGTVRIDASGGLMALDSPSGNTAWLPTVITVVFPMLAAFWLAFLGRLVLSWRRSSGERRQQLKWQAIANFINDAGFVVFAVCVGVAISKYRLYDIDRIISGALAHAIVTGLLIGVYVGLVTRTTRVLPFTSAVGVAMSTLAAAAIFNPVRRRVQHPVDRRFNRTRYDADQTVAVPAARLKDAVDLDSVRDGTVAANGCHGGLGA